jgi:hypothetical protein
MTRISTLTCLLLAALCASADAQARTVTFTPTNGVPTFAKREPILRVKPGTIVETKTFSKAGDYYEPAGPGPWPGEVGPFYIEGATPNDTLVVKILRLGVNRDTAISAINPAGISGLAADGRTRLMNDPLPARRWVGTRQERTWACSTSELAVEANRDSSPSDARRRGGAGGE